MICEDDASLPRPVSEMMLNKVKGKNWKIESLKSGHCPFLSRPDKVIEIVQRA